MSLRGRLLGLFSILAVVPLLAVGVFDYVRSLGALESLLIAQTSIIAERAATDLADRYRVIEADVALLAENAETRTFVATPPSDPRWATRRDSMARFIESIWDRVGTGIVSIVYRDRDGAELYRFGSDGRRENTYDLVRDVPGHDAGSAGRLEIALRLDSLLPQTALQTRLGRAGFSFVVDEARDSVLFADGQAVLPPATVLAADPRASTPIAYADGSVRRVGTRIRLEHPRFTVVTVAARDEFAAPFAAIRNTNFAAVVLLTLGVAAAFIALLWRGTRPLAELTAAADHVARGNLQPSLPPPGADEVGRLSRAFAYMLDRIRAMLREIEQSRQMAAIGEFAAQISHEIRNPLTSIKLNLQKLERAAGQGTLPADLKRPVEISLLEIQRLDRVVRGVLRLGSPAAETRSVFPLRDAVARAVEAVRPQLERQGIVIETAAADGDDRVAGNPEMLQSMIVDLLINALEAMPDGGSIHLSTEVASNGRLRLRVEDDGPGLAEGERERVFAPFVTSKATGTGLGLALAQRTVERHQGSIIAVAPRRGRGASFVIELPLARDTE